MPKTIKLSELADNYKAGVAAKSTKWFNHASTATGVIAAGSSEAAEKNYADHMNIVVQNKLRQKGLGKVSDSTVASLPAKTADAATNVANRVTPIAVALQKQKRGA